MREAREGGRNCRAVALKSGQSQMAILRSAWKKPLDFGIRNSFVALKEQFQVQCAEEGQSTEVEKAKGSQARRQ